MAEPLKSAREAVIRKAGLLRDLMRDGRASDDNVDELEQELCDAVEAMREVQAGRKRKRRG